jgi:hypothetical protein
MSRDLCVLPLLGLEGRNGIEQAGFVRGDQLFDGVVECQGGREVEEVLLSPRPGEVSRDVLDGFPATMVPCSASQVTSSSSCDVVVPNTRTLGSPSARAGPQTQCSRLPTSIPATMGRMACSAIGTPRLLVLLDSPAFFMIHLR